MTHVVVVHPDADMADQESDWLRQAGYIVDECAGPTNGPCPVLNGQPCAAVEGADVLVYDMWAGGDTQSEQELIELLRELHPSIPIVLTGPGLEFDWVEIVGEHKVVPLVGTPSAARLTGAVEAALASVAGSFAPPA